MPATVLRRKYPVKPCLFGISRLAANVVAWFMNAVLRDLLPKIESWPVEDQAELAEAVRMIEARRSGIYVPSDDELAGIDRGLADAGAGRFAAQDRLETVLAKFRNA